jgi:hypothetical protein
MLRRRADHPDYVASKWLLSGPSTVTCMFIVCRTSNYYYIREAYPPSSELVVIDEGLGSLSKAWHATVRSGTECLLHLCNGHGHEEDGNGGFNVLMCLFRVNTENPPDLLHFCTPESFPAVHLLRGSFFFFSKQTPLQ